MLLEFDTFQEAFDCCRKRNHPIIVEIKGSGKWKVYPSGKATRIGEKQNDKKAK